MDFIRAWTLNLLYVSVITAFIRVLLPENTLKKTALTAAGLLMLYTLAAPVVTGVLSENKDFFRFSVPEGDGGSAAEELFEKETKENGLFDQIQVLETYRQRLERQVENRVLDQPGVDTVKAEITLVEDPASSRYGAVLSVHIWISMETAGGGGGNSRDSRFPAGIGKIIIEAKGTSRNAGTARITEADVPVEGSLGSIIRENAAELLGIREDQVQVTLRL